MIGGLGVSWGGKRKRQKRVYKGTRLAIPNKVDNMSDDLETRGRPLEACIRIL